MSSSREQRGPSGDVPQIIIQYTGTEPPTIEYIEYGIEEEGVPWRTQSANDESGLSEETATEIAYQAASNSRLKIGIGIASDAAHTLHHARLPAEKPVLSMQITANSQARTIGTNAARLAKRRPLKMIEK